MDKKNVVFFTSVYPEDGYGNLYFDLVKEIENQGYHVDVVTPIERKYKKSTTCIQNGDINVFRVKSLNFRGKVSLIEKGIATLWFLIWFKKVYYKYLKQNHYDIAIFATLPITYAPVIKILKKKGTYIYLLHKDFFPENAVDLNILSKNSIMYKIFEKCELSMYRYSDSIGVMSKGNKEYILKLNKGITEEMVDICPNSIIPSSNERIAELTSHKDEIREKYQIPKDAVVFIYGGVISRAQGTEYIISLVKHLKECNDAFFLFVGSGNTFDDLKKEIKKNNCENVKILSYIPKYDYDLLMASCDVGMVFLDYNFTVPNIPSRMLGHIDLSQPIIAATDEHTDFKDILIQNQIGLWNASNNPHAFVENVNRFVNSTELRIEMGINARQYLLESCSATASYKEIIKHIM